MNRWLMGRVFEYHTYDVRGRIYSELLRLFETSEQGVIAVTDRDLASRVGTTRENVTRIHRDLKQRGLIERSQSQIRLLDIAGLQTLMSSCEFS